MEGENSIRGVFGLPIYLDRIEELGLARCHVNLVPCSEAAAYAGLALSLFLLLKSLRCKDLGRAGQPPAT